MINYKLKYEELQREVSRLKLKMRNKDNIVRSIIKKLNIKEPNSTLKNNLLRLNLDDLIVLEDRIK